MNAISPPIYDRDLQQRSCDAAFVLLQDFNDDLTPEQHTQCSVTLAMNPDEIGIDFSREVIAIYVAVAGVRV